MTRQGGLLNEKNRSRFNTILLILVVFIVFAVPLFPHSLYIPFYNVLFTLIFFTAALSMEKYRKQMIMIALIITVVEWIAVVMDRDILITLSRLGMFLFFIFVVIGLIVQIAKTKKVTARVIIESINGYLLLGLLFSVCVAVVRNLNPEAFSFKGEIPVGYEIGYNMSQCIYYTFTTFTTLGYGDIVPLVPYAKTIAVFSAVCGQIYLAVIIAMLVGKFLSYSREAA
jgi:hypothetical protein